MNIQGYVKLPESFYLREDVVAISEQLLGKCLFTYFDGMLTAGRIVETEAYKGGWDKASHASKGRTPRTEAVFQPGGRTYVYLCYGIHHLLNIVTNEKDKPDCVLIRAVEPIMGSEEMLLRTGKSSVKRITAGPGLVAKGLGLTTKMNGLSLTGDQIWIAEEKQAANFEVVKTTRIGVDYAGEDAQLPWRFYVDGNPFVSVLKK